MNYSQRDKERILKYRQLLSYVARAFYDGQSIVVMDSFLQHFFSNFLVETQEITESTCLPKEVVREVLYNFQKSRLIKSL